MSQPKRFIETTEHYPQSHHQIQHPSLTSSSLPSSYPLTAIKLEPQSSLHYNYHIMESTRNNPMLTTAMPIPRTKLGGDYSDFNYEYDQSQSPQLTQDTTYITSTSDYGLDQSSGNSNAMWSVIGDAMALSKQEPFPMDDDDIFQVDKNDLFQGPTLAELNDTFLGDLNIDDFILPSENSVLLPNNATLAALQPHSFHATTMPPQQLLQQHNQQNHTGSLHHLQTTAAQAITIGRDALLYDEQTNTSSSPYDIYGSAQKSHNTSAFSPGSQASSNSPQLISSISPPPYIMNNNNNNLTTNNNNNNNNSIQRGKYTTLQDLLRRDYPVSPDRTELGQSVPGPSGQMIRNPDSYQSRRLHFTTLQTPGTSRLSSSAPTNSTAAWEAHQVWQRREPRQHLLSTGSLAEAGSTSSLSTGGILSPDPHDFSHDEGYEDSDSDHYEDYSSDNGWYL